MIQSLTLILIVLVDGVLVSLLEQSADVKAREAAECRPEQLRQEVGDGLEH